MQEADLSASGNGNTAEPPFAPLEKTYGSGFGRITGIWHSPVRIVADFVYNQLTENRGFPFRFTAILSG